MAGAGDAADTVASAGADEATTAGAGDAADTATSAGVVAVPIAGAVTTAGAVVLESESESVLPKSPCARGAGVAGVSDQGAPAMGTSDFGAVSDSHAGAAPGSAA